MENKYKNLFCCLKLFLVLIFSNQFFFLLLPILKMNMTEIRKYETQTGLKKIEPRINSNYNIHHTTVKFPESGMSSEAIGKHLTTKSAYYCIHVE